MSVRVATSQYRTGDNVDANLHTLLSLIAEAAEAGAQLLVAPEFGNHTSFYQDAAHAWEVAVSVEGDYVKVVQEAAAQHAIHVVFNATCRGGQAGQIFIRNFLVGPDGALIGWNDKQVLMGGEAIHLSGADRPGQVFETRIGRIGMMSCLDGVPPECARNLALRGAQIITNGHNSCALDEPYTHIPVIAAENHVWVIAAGKVGPVCSDDMLQPLADQVGIPAHLIIALGENPILDPRGVAVARFESEAAGLLLAEIDVELADDKRWADGDLFADRRPELYAPVAQPLPDSTDAGIVAGSWRGGVLQLRNHRRSEVTVNRVCDLLADAAVNGVRMMVVPELFMLSERPSRATLEAALAQSEHARQRLQQTAAEAAIGICFSGVFECRGDVTHSAILIGDNGEEWGRYAQTHLTHSDRQWAAAGSECPVIETPLGRIGLMIGYDAVFPEFATSLARQGAEVILHPTTWRFDWEPSLVICERASENRVSILSAARWDSPVRRGGMINALSLSQPLRAADLNPIWPVEAPFDRELYISAEIDPARSRNKDLIGFDLQAGRRFELYDRLTET